MTIKNVLLYMMLSALMLIAAAAVRAGDWDRLSGQESGIKRPMTVVVKSQQELQDLWKRHAVGALAIPTVDFRTEMLVGVFLGEKTTAGYKVDLVLQKDPLDPARLVVYYREVPPRAADFQAQVICRPYELRKVPKTYTAVDFAYNYKVKALGGEEDFVRAPSGLSPEAAERMRGTLERLDGIKTAPQFDGAPVFPR